MRIKRVMFLSLFAMLFACNGGEQKEEASNITTVDSLPEGKWNGEYIEVEDSLAEENKPKRKSNGSAYYNMGTVKVSMDTMNFSIDLFDQKKNHLTISRNSLMMRIKSAQRDFLSIQLKKPDIMNDYTGTYKIDPDGSKPTSSAIDFNRLSSKHQMQLTMVKGSTTVESFSPRLGKIVLEAKGTFQDAEGNESPGTVKVNMRFESVVSTFNPSNS